MCDEKETLTPESIDNFDIDSSDEIDLDDFDFDLDLDDFDFDEADVEKIDLDVKAYQNPSEAYSDLMKQMKDSFEAEEKFIRERRACYSKLIFSLIIISYILIIAITILAFVFELDMGVYISAFVALVVESLGLLKILFEYLFNRKDNKVLEIISNTLKNFGEYWKNKNDNN
ncbi:MAG: hypothetical protein J1F31_01840 [Erysipelotrichales bacterium]|nr:hypothetical protein [Erysipelotrichales bacterium]